MIRKIIKINEALCNGCGLCAQACHEGAIDMVNGKAKLVREHYCDGLGDCLPACPTGAISFEEREAPAYDEAAVKAAQAAKTTGTSNPSAQNFSLDSQLTQWPVQIKLAPLSAPYFQNADLLIAADCTAYAYGNFHHDFIRGHVTLIGCPKLDSIDYTEKLTAILSQNDIRSILVARMQVPCCGGIERAVRNAVAASGKDIPCQVKIISPNGTILQ
ncbi:ATP-binding protein [Sellimonas caecigallum]|uniref:Ferredoxin n=1 Tax=Sellimonas caecigallum TaxID=2592333 RepID=A0ABS7L787_9FIRM|nr:4Fe-4S binding protein [Sellimonas caecigallum]MBY0758808.1 ferredoxin [Sellimonas caecigallum]